MRLTCKMFDDLLTPLVFSRVEVRIALMKTLLEAENSPGSQARAKIIKYTQSLHIAGSGDDQNELAIADLIQKCQILREFRYAIQNIQSCPLDMEYPF